MMYIMMNQIDEFIRLYPVQQIKHEVLVCTVCDTWRDFLINYIESYIGINENFQEIKLFLDDILIDPTEFFQSIVEDCECGASLVITELTKDVNNLTEAYDFVTSDLEELYGLDFTFDPKEFGYEIFCFNGKKYIVGGVAC